MTKKGSLDFLFLIYYIESRRRLPIGQIYEVMKKASPETMRDVKMRAFGKHLALMGVKKLHTRYGDQYLLNRL